MASKSYIGTVTEVSQTPWPDRDTGKEVILHSFQIEGTGTWFRTGETDPKLSVGDIVKFCAVRQKVDLATLEPATASEAAKAPKSASGSGRATSGSTTSRGGTNMSRDGYWKERDRYDKEVRQPMIAYQSARKDAVQIVTAALAADILALGQKKADKLDLLLGYVDEVTTSLNEKYREFEAALSE